MTVRSVIRGAGIVWLASIAVVLLTTLPARFGRSDGASRSFAWSGVAGEASRLELRGSSGSFRVVAGADDSVRVRVQARPDAWKPRSIFSSSDPADLRNARLVAKSESGALRFEVDPGSSGRMLEEWVAEVPARFAASVRAGDGTIEVRGVSGGVQASANAGEHSAHGRIEVDVPAGGVEARLRVGTVWVRTQGTDLGDVKLAAEVGKTELWIDGHRLERRDPPGPGSMVALAREGADRIDARVSVGDVVVRIR